MNPPVRFKTAERLFITYRGKRVLGRVMLGSSNGYSLMLTFDAMLGGYVGMMPVLWLPDLGEYRCLIEDETVCLAPAHAITEPELVSKGAK